MQRELLSILEAADEPLSLDTLARLLYGERLVRRSWGRRVLLVSVPAGDTANVRRAVLALVRMGLVDEVFEADEHAPPRRRYGVK